MNTYKDLTVWQKSIDLTEANYALTERCPKLEEIMKMLNVLTKKLKNG